MTQKPSPLAAVERLYGADDLCSPRAVREYLERVRRVQRAAAAEIGDTAEMLTQVLRNSPGVGILLGADSRWNARYVCAPLHEAANATNVSAQLTILSWQRFQARFAETMESSRSRSKKQMDWEDI